MKKKLKLVELLPGCFKSKKPNTRPKNTGFLMTGWADVEGVTSKWEQTTGELSLARQGLRRRLS